jgi:hypothetical protein
MKEKSVIRSIYTSCVSVLLDKSKLITQFLCNMSTFTLEPTVTLYRVPINYLNCMQEGRVL